MQKVREKFCQEKSISVDQNETFEESYMFNSGILSSHHVLILFISGNFCELESICLMRPAISMSIWSWFEKKLSLFLYHNQNKSMHKENILPRLSLNLTKQGIDFVKALVVCYGTPNNSTNYPFYLTASTRCLRQSC